MQPPAALPHRPHPASPIACRPCRRPAGLPVGGAVRVPGQPAGRGLRGGAARRGRGRPLQVAWHACGGRVQRPAPCLRQGTTGDDLSALKCGRCRGCLLLQPCSGCFESPAGFRTCTGQAAPCRPPTRPNPVPVGPHPNFLLMLTRRHGMPGCPCLPAGGWRTPTPQRRPPGWTPRTG